METPIIINCLPPMSFPGCDKMEALENKRVTEALSLLDEIQDRLDQTSFTLDDIKECVNGRKEISHNRPREMIYGESHLETLQKLEVIEQYEDNPEVYFVRQDSPIVIRSEMDDYSHFCEDF